MLSDRKHQTEGLVIKTVRTEELSPPARSAIIDLCIAAHGEPDFQNLFTYIPLGGRHFVAFLGAAIVSHAVVTTRWVQPEGHAALKTAYVDAVATAPAHQGRGIGSAVMGHLATEIDDYAIACLETERPEFYERLGWQLWRGTLAGRSAAGLVPTPDQRGVMVLQFQHTPELDLDSRLSIEVQGSRIW